MLCASVNAEHRVRRCHLLPALGVGNGKGVFGWREARDLCRVVEPFESREDVGQRCGKPVDRDVVTNQAARADTGPPLDERAALLVAPHLAAGLTMLGQASVQAEAQVCARGDAPQHIVGRLIYLLNAQIPWPYFVRVARSGHQQNHK